MQPTTTDRDIRRKYLGGETVASIAGELGHSKDSVRGRIHRASLEDRVALARELAESQPLINIGTERQQAVLRRSDQSFQEKQWLLQKRGTAATAVFISDIHIPYTNWDALYLFLLIIQNIQPDYISAMNDLFDFEGYGRWGDTRSPAQKLWSDDIENALSTSREIHQAYFKAAPNAMLLQLQGNHDGWMYTYIRDMFRNGFSEHNIAYFMEQLEAQRVVQFVDGTYKKENIIKLSPGLKWVHGISAAKSTTTVAKMTSDACRDEEDSGIFYDTVSGHTHRAFVSAINGRKHYNSGCVMIHDPRYLKHRPAWDTAIVISRFDPNGRWHDGTLVEVKKRGGKLVARYDGVDYDAPIT